MKAIILFLLSILDIGFLYIFPYNGNLIDCLNVVSFMFLLNFTVITLVEYLGGNKE